MKMSGKLYILIFFTVLKFTNCQNETVTVKVAQGDLRGKVSTTVNGLKYYSFRGVPYAKPPVGSLRFKPPQPPDAWEGVRDALEHGSVCPQTGNIKSEDCLFLNIYTYQLAQNSSEKLLPVLVWVHGGSLASGSGNIAMQGPDYILKEDVVMVSINYRLGPLGFISLQGTEITSNNGARDQTMALQWIQQNIAQFGGDPKRVTLWGESAGSRSVHYQILSPMAKGLFHQAIGESGTALAPHAIYAPGAAKDTAFKLGKALGVTTNETSVLIEALYNATAEELLKARDKSGLAFTVDIEYDGEEAFLPGPPMDLIKQGKYNDVPLLIGTNANEGLLNVGQIYQNPSYAEYINKHFEDKIPWHFKNATEIAAKVKKFYLGEKEVSQETILKFIKVDTDFLYLFPTDRLIKLQAQVSKTPVYEYRFTFDGQLGLSKRYQGDYIPGISHADELGYIFYMSPYDPDVDPNSAEKKTLARIVKMWSNFVKTGNPTPEQDPLLQNITWRPFTEQDHFYLEIGNDLTLKREIEIDRMGFMADLYSNVNVPM